MLDRDISANMTISLMDQNHDHLKDVTAMTGAEIMRLDDTCFPGSENETDCKDGVSNMSAPRRQNSESG
ncbi:hypothetical protein D1823_09930 [Ruegeria sp. AD91A]|nr:hypothetical protein D1823_09930 [Ruegeria sp. AD91A]